ncbi:MAG: S8 family peptidase [Elusimicrobia bacterium]|nr:S8 family peptidase [Elusimicrobiota bacterium]
MKLANTILISAFSCLLVSPALAAVRVQNLSTGKTLGIAQGGQVLVKFSASAGAGCLQAHGQIPGASILDKMESSGWTQIALPPSVSIEQAMAAYGGDAGHVVDVQPNFIYHPVGTAPNDPMAASQYWLEQVDAYGGWSFETGASSRTTVAVLDTGIETTHPDLAANLHAANRMYNAVPPTSTGTAAVADILGHGTGVAGMAAAVGNNAVGIAGMSWSAKILPVQIFHNGTGNPDCDIGDVCANDADIVRGIEYVVSAATSNVSEFGRTVINMSLGCKPDILEAECPPNCTTAMQNAITLASNNNILVVAASGNSDSSNGFFTQVQCPAKIANVVAVGATTLGGAIANFSGRGSELDVVAPGQSVLTAKTSGGYGNQTGTSFASPLVAGLVSLLMSAKPDVSTATLVDTLRNSAEDLGSAGFDTTYGWGEVDAYAALRLLTRGSLTALTGKPEAYPNPFHNDGSKTLTIRIPPAFQGNNLNVQFYTMTGELVDTQRSLSWDGRNEAGRRVASGVYIYTVRTDKGFLKGRVAVIH